MLLLRALLLFLTPSRTPWYKRLAEYIFCKRPDRLTVLLSIDHRKEVFSYRYEIFNSRWLNIGVHNIVRHDEAMLHNHDWSFISWVLEGGYKEHLPDGTAPERRKGALMYRPWHYRHYVELLERCSWTLLIVGPKVNVHQFEVPRYGMIRWDLLIFRKLIDLQRETLTSDEIRYALDNRTEVPCCDVDH